MDTLRDRDAEYLRAVRGLLKNFDKALEQTAPSKKNGYAGCGWLRSLSPYSEVAQSRGPRSRHKKARRLQEDQPNQSNFLVGGLIRL